MDSKQQVKDTTDKFCNSTIKTPIKELIEKCNKYPKDKLIHDINEHSKVMLLLQYKLREHSVVDWYKKLNVTRKTLHDTLDDNRDLIEVMSENKNWVVMSSIPLESIQQKKLNSVFLSFYENADEMTDVIDSLNQEQLENVLAVPLFNIN